MIGYYNRSVIATYTGLVCSVIGMRFSMLGSFRAALICLMICGLLDMIDGPIARRCKRSDNAKAFGVQIDSLCDLVCFGAQPAIFIMNMDSFSWVSCISCALFILAGVIRLGFFNVQEINRASTETSKRKYYDGLVITASAGFVPLYALADCIIKSSFGGFYWIMALALGLSYITPIKIKKLGGKGLTVCGIIGASILTGIIILGSSLTR